MRIVDYAGCRRSRLADFRSSRARSLNERLLGPNYNVVARPAREGRLPGNGRSSIAWWRAAL
jgi:hypothetical protein